MITVNDTAERSAPPVGWTSIDDAAEVRAGLVHRDTLYRLARENRIRVARLSQRRLLIRVAWLDELADASAPMSH